MTALSAPAAEGGPCPDVGRAGRLIGGGPAEGGRTEKVLEGNGRKKADAGRMEGGWYGNGPAGDGQIRREMELMGFYDLVRLITISIKNLII
jgi:hypothetical protein